MNSEGLCQTSSDPLQLLACKTKKEKTQIMFFQPEFPSFLNDHHSAHLRSPLRGLWNCWGLMIAVTFKVYSLTAQDRSLSVFACVPFYLVHASLNTCFIYYSAEEIGSGRQMVLDVFVDKSCAKDLQWLLCMFGRNKQYKYRIPKALPDLAFLSTKYELLSWKQGRVLNSEHNVNIKTVDWKWLKLHLLMSIFYTTVYSSEVIHMDSVIYFLLSKEGVKTLKGMRIRREICPSLDSLQCVLHYYFSMGSNLRKDACFLGQGTYLCSCSSLKFSLKVASLKF